MIEALAARALLLVPLWLSLAVHEWAHAAAADAFGDDTARLMGRKSLDPLVHLDPVGTVLLPLIGVPIGWANPVPVNPLRFRGVSQATGLWLTAGAGPASNVVLALACAGLYRALPVEQVPAIAWLLSRMVPLNLGLAMFNLLPIPPLDGGRIVDAAVPYAWRGGWSRVQRVAPYLLVPGLVLAEAFASGPFTALARAAEWLLRG